MTSSVSNACDTLVGFVIKSLDVLIFETVFWMNRQYLFFETWITRFTETMKDYPITYGLIQLVAGLVYWFRFTYQTLGQYLFYRAVEYDTPYVSCYVLRWNDGAFEMKETSHIFTIEETYSECDVDMDVLADMDDSSDEDHDAEPDHSEWKEVADAEDAEEEDDEEESSSSDGVLDNLNGSLYQMTMHGKKWIDQRVAMSDVTVIAKDDENRYLVKVGSGKWDAQNSLAWHENVASTVSFLTVEYHHPKQTAALSLDIPREYFYVGNELFSAAFLYRYLMYQSVFTSFVFDTNYVVSIIDDEINTIQLRFGQYLELRKHDYVVCTVQEAAAPQEAAAAESDDSDILPPLETDTSDDEVDASDHAGVVEVDSPSGDAPSGVAMKEHLD